MHLKDFKTIYLIIFCFLVITLSSCLNILSDGDISTDGHTPRLVVDGLITTEPGPYFVQLTLSGNLAGPFSKNIVPVTDATVTISDAQGNVDVLKPFDEKYIIFDGIDNPDRTWADLGYYQTTTNMQGVPGGKYTLSIVYDGKTYEATATIPRSNPTLELKHEDSFELPFIYFDEPQNVKNYYMFYYSSFRDGKSTRSNYALVQHESIPRNLWSTFPRQNLLYDDTYLPARVERLDIYQNTNYQIFSDTTLFDPDSSTVEMHSVTQEVYDLYQALENQKKNDGGTFNGLPGDPPTNLSNGALGFFRASAVSRKTIPFTR
ncbi:hypothetical protein BKI52_03855 [marine bacterium AO1-C]|nr:hypothetical protein BKI52_03855 [marine bacterium AO1-C]